MVTSPYARQWISPRASQAFTPFLLLADYHCMQGNLSKSLTLYRSEAPQNFIAKRRLSIIQRQLRKSLSFAADMQNSNVLLLGFIDWYSGFNNDAHLIIDLFVGAGLNVRLSDVNEADILIAGCYGTQLITNPELSRDKLVILFTGENICPSYDKHDFSISTRSRSYSGKNVRYPQWLSDLCLDEGSIVFRFPASYQPTKSEHRDFLVSAVYNNSTPEREEFLALLRQTFGSENIHVFGSQRTGEIDKLQVLSRSVVNLCFENSLGEGYVTEKLLHARIMGCKALYWGHPSYINDFKNIDILNVHDLKGSTQSVIDWCRKQFMQRRSAPLPQTSILDPLIFTSRPTHEPIYKQIQEWTKLVLAWRLPRIPK